MAEVGAWLSLGRAQQLEAEWIHKSLFRILQIFFFLKIEFEPGCQFVRCCQWPNMNTHCLQVALQSRRGWVPKICSRLVSSD